ncbi:pseudouridine synthase [Candidatus Odyssella thessalonicensis]|uniref:pseudouridine synthase n=1 Tax=Candidatus Odyssella thessalonicensis TaxID=84647 RepID=UPI000225A918|nr:pseudouridine synthase [Candidatus Odyssella thessalonicensis]
MTLQKERIAKRIAAAGLCSRRDAERWIEAGRVSVDGTIITSPALDVSSANKIFVDGKLLPESQKPRLWGYYKPTGIITTHHDPQGRPTVFEQLSDRLPRVISIGRLDLNSEGLLLLTTDSSMARYAELPSTNWPRRYRVRVYGDIDPQALADLANGITIEGINYGQIDVDMEQPKGRNCWLFMTLYEGKNREIRRVMQHLGLHVNRLIRVAYGEFSLDKKQPGDVWEIPYSTFVKHFPHLKQASAVRAVPPQHKDKGYADRRRKK